MKNILTLAIILLFSVACSQNTVKEEDSKINESTTVKTVKNETPEKTANTDNKIEKKIIIPKEVSAKYKSLIMEVGYKKPNKSVDTDILIGQKAEIAGTPLTIELEAYLPDFVMNESSIMTSKSAEENNPAAKIKVFKSGNLVFDGWLFKNFPDAHPFDDPDYTLNMKSAVQK